MSVCVYHCVPVRVRVRLQRILAAVEKQFFPVDRKNTENADKNALPPAGRGTKTPEENRTATHTHVTVNESASPSTYNCIGCAWV